EQRQLGLRLAKTLGARKTQDIIKDPTSSYELIIKTALMEIGLDKLIPNVLEGPPEWAVYALRNIPNPGSHRDALLRKAAEDPESALHTLRFVPELGSHRRALTQKAGAHAVSSGEISSFYLNNKGSYNCEFTMMWMDNGLTQPTNGYGNWSDWVWSPKLNVGQDATMSCVKFAKQKAPLQNGDEVWILMWVESGHNIESPLRFTYNSNTSQTAYFTSSGCTQNDSLALDKVA